MRRLCPAWNGGVTLGVHTCGRKEAHCLCRLLCGERVYESYGGRERDMRTHDGPQLPNHTEHSALRPTPRQSSLNCCHYCQHVAFSTSARRERESIWLQSTDGETQHPDQQPWPINKKTDLHFSVLNSPALVLLASSEAAVYQPCLSSSNTGLVETVYSIFNSFLSPGFSISHHSEARSRMMSQLPKEETQVYDEPCMWLKDRWTPFNTTGAYTHFSQFTVEAGFRGVHALTKALVPTQGQEALYSQISFYVGMSPQKLSFSEPFGFLMDIMC